MFIQNLLNIKIKLVGPVVVQYYNQRSRRSCLDLTVHCSMAEDYDCRWYDIFALLRWTKRRGNTLKQGLNRKQERRPNWDQWHKSLGLSRKARFTTNLIFGGYVLLHGCACMVNWSICWHVSSLVPRFLTNISGIWERYDNVTRTLQRFATFCQQSSKFHVLWACKHRPNTHDYYPARRRKG